MFRFFQKLITGTREIASVSAQPPEQAQEQQPDVLQAPGVAGTDLTIHMPELGGFPTPDWDVLQRWVDAIPSEPDQIQAWSRLELAWMQRLKTALGPGYTIKSADDVLLLSSLDDATAKSTLAHVSRSRQRVLHTLNGVAELPAWGCDILLVLDDHDTYYRYVSNHYPAEGEFALSGGMYLNAGCGHFVVVKDDLLAIEPTIIHELTHSCLSHLPLPTWLNEGLAVNTEHRFYPQANGSHRSGHDASRMHRRHQRFWGVAEIQQFWSGDSYTRTDEGNELSYDLGRILTSRFATDWPRFAAFANAANHVDAGAKAAEEFLGLTLGQAVCVLLEKEYEATFEPTPSQWTTPALSEAS